MPKVVARDICWRQAVKALGGCQSANWLAQATRKGHGLTASLMIYCA